MRPILRASPAFASLTAAEAPFGGAGKPLVVATPSSSEADEPGLFATLAFPLDVHAE